MAVAPEAPKYEFHTKNYTGESLDLGTTAAKIVEEAGGDFNAWSDVTGKVRNRLEVHRAKLGQRVGAVAGYANEVDAAAEYNGILQVLVQLKGEHNIQKVIGDTKIDHNVQNALAGNSLTGIDNAVRTAARSQKERVVNEIRGQQASGQIDGYWGTPARNQGVDTLIATLRLHYPDFDSKQEQIIRIQYNEKAQKMANQFIDRYKNGQMTSQAFLNLRGNTGIPAEVRNLITAAPLEKTDELRAFNDTANPQSAANFYNDAIAQCNSLVNADGEIDETRLTAMVDSHLGPVPRSAEERAKRARKNEILRSELAQEIQTRQAGMTQNEIDRESEIEKRWLSEKTRFKETIKHYGQLAKFILVPALLLGVGGGVLTGLASGNILLGVGAGLAGATAGIAGGSFVGEWKNAFSQNEIRKAHKGVIEANTRLRGLTTKDTDDYREHRAELASIIASYTGYRIDLNNPQAAVSGFLKHTGISSEAEMINSIRAYRTSNTAPS